MEYSVETIMGLIDHTVLGAFAPESDVKRLIDEAHEFGNAAVCIEPVHLDFARDYINMSGFRTKVAVVLDFPLGASFSRARKLLIDAYSGMSDEIDIVAPIALVKSDRFDLVENDINELVQVTHKNNRTIKVIVEDAYTTLDEKKKLYEIVCRSGADFIKTGTGFEDKKYAESIGNKTGAQTENVKLMADIADKYNPNIGIKAAGGIHTYADIIALLGASRREANPNKFRIGASGTRQIREEMLVRK